MQKMRILHLEHKHTVVLWPKAAFTPPFAKPNHSNTSAKIHESREVYATYPGRSSWHKITDIAETRKNENDKLKG